MKRNKLITRVFALLTSLVLVLALALPCFADENDQPTDDYVTVRIRSSDDLLNCNLEKGVTYIALFYCDYLGQVTSGRCTFSTNTSGIFFLVYNGTGSQPGAIYNESLVLGNSSDVGYAYTVVYFDGTEESESVPLDDIEFTLLVFVPSQEDDIIEEQGWYGQIKNIIKDAVFGSDTVLNDSQEFTLNQIALWLSLVVILLPFVIVAVIVVRCFR